MSSRRRGKSKKKEVKDKRKDLWVKLLEARGKAKKAREQKIDDDLEKLLSGGGGEEKPAEAEAKEGDAPVEGEGKTADDEAAKSDAAKSDAAKPDAEATTAAAAAEKVDGSLETNADKCQENILLFVGAKDSGKTTQVQLFLNPSGKDSKPKPTTALEYTFGRKANGNIKNVAHIWELGGGLRLRSMLPVVIKPSNIQKLRVVIVLDLSQPGDAIPLLEKWLKLIRQNVSTAISAMKKDKKMQRLATRLQNQALAQWVKNEDMKKIDVTPVPILVLCTKLDILMEQSTVKRKAVLNAIRFLCLSNGASCVTTDHKTKLQIQFVRGYLNHYGFGADLKASEHRDSGKSLVIPAGADTFAALGAPNGVDASVYTNSPSEDARLNMWRKAIELHFDPTGAEKDIDVTKDDVESQEPSVDAMVERKREQLVQYRKEVERRNKMAAAEAKKRR